MTKARQLADLISSGSIETAEITSLDAAKLTGNIADARVPASAVTQHANNYTHPNHSGEVTSTADGATVITDNIVDEANLKVSNTPTNGYMLTAQSGNTGGLTWADAPSGTHVKLVSGSASSSVNHDFQNFMDTSKYNSYMVQFSKVIGLASNALHFQFVANTTVLTNSNYWWAFHGHRSTNNEIVNYGEQSAQAPLGSAMVGSSGNAANYLFHIYNNPNSTNMGNNVYGHNWGYRSDLGDYLFTDYAFGFNNSHNVTGFRVHAEGNDATTFDYAIYGIAK